MKTARRGIAALGCAVAVLAVPSSATAATTCSYASQVLQVDLGAAGDDANLAVAGDGGIGVSDQVGAVIACTGTPPTVGNTNAIAIVNHPGSSNNLITLRDGFSPGATDEPGTDEIEIFPTLNDAPGSSLLVRGAAAGADVRVGDSGINTNASAIEDTPDADIFPAGVPQIQVVGGPGPDTLGAQGGAGTGGPLATPISFPAGAGADSLTGGGGADSLFGENGADTLQGMSGDDALYPGIDNDQVDGGAGADRVQFSDNSVGVTVDLTIAGPQQTGGSGTDSLAGVESVFGSLGPDVLRGDAGPNTLHGLAGGDDRLEGRGGVDTLVGGEGSDAIEARDSGPDSIDCGTGTDQVTADAPGVDSLISCEILSFPTPPPVPGPGAAGRRDLTPPRMSRFGLSRRTFAAAAKGRSVAKAGRKPKPKTATTVRYALSESARVTFTVEHLRRGRYRKLKGSFTHSGRTGANRFKFTGRMRNRKLRPGRYRLVASASDAARNRSKPSRVKFRIASR